MAEFQEVAGQKRRMCKMYEKNGCNGCPLSNGDCGVLNIRYTDANDVQRVENVVMSWAAEHPVVYPTWGEWFVENGDLIDGWQNATNAAWMANTALDVFMKPIPADIAQKLGIKPKGAEEQEAQDG